MGGWVGMERWGYVRACSTRGRPNMDRDFYMYVHDSVYIRIIGCFFKTTAGERDGGGGRETCCTTVCPGRNGIYRRPYQALLCRCDQPPSHRHEPNSLNMCKPQPPPSVEPIKTIYSRTQIANRTSIPGWGPDRTAKQHCYYQGATNIEHSTYCTIYEIDR